MEMLLPSSNSLSLCLELQAEKGEAGSSGYTPEPGFGVRELADSGDVTNNF